MTDHLPANWLSVPLAEVVDINPGIDKSKLRDGEEVPFVSMSAVEAETGRIDTIERRLFGAVKSGFTAFASGDVLFAKITPCMENGKMAIVPSLPSNVGFGSTEFHVLRPSSAVDRGLLYYFVSSLSLRHEAQHQMTGAVGQKRVPKRYLENKMFRLPPLNEQRRIVGKIETLFARLDKGEEALREVQKLLARYRQSVLKAAFTGQLTADWREEHSGAVEHGRDLLARILQARRDAWQGRGTYKEPVAPDTTGLPELPEGWVWASLDSLISDGPTNGISPKEIDRGGCLSFKLTATTSGKFLINDNTLKRVDIEPDTATKYWLQPGDVLVQRGNTIDYVGTAAVFPGPQKKFIYPDLMMRIRFSDAVIASWSVYWMNFELAKRHFRRFATGIAGNMPKISGRTLRSLPVPLPPKNEVRLCLESIKATEAKALSLSGWCDAELTRSRTLRQSILKDAFAGRLVPQDPTDEPALALLKRIQEARAAAPPKAQRRALRKELA